jgi:hypothetical protein
MEKGSCSAGAGDAAKTGSCGSGNGKGCGVSKCLGAMLLGGILIFAWFGISWMVLPWHKTTMMGFKDEAAVVKVLAKNATASGVYVAPWTDFGKTEQKTEKPFVFMSVKAEGMDVKNGMNERMLKDFFVCLFMAGLLACLLKKSSGCPGALGIKVGLIAGLAGYMPHFIWFGFPIKYTLVGIADCVIAFTLAGAIVGKFVYGMKLGCCAQGSCGTKGDCGTKPTGSCGA